MRFIIAAIAILFCHAGVANQLGAGKACTYTYAPGSVKVFATGYKFTEKMGAKGEFKDPQVFFPPSAATIDDLMLGTSIEIDGSKFDTGDPARDTNIRDFFFRKMKGGIKIKGKVESHRSDILKVRVSINGVSKSVAFLMTKDGAKYSGRTDIDIVQTFKMQKVLDSLHRVCNGLHKGPDGISKTWSQVSLELKAEIIEDCKGAPAGATRPGDADQGTGPAGTQPKGGAGGN